MSDDLSKARAIFAQGGFAEGLADSLPADLQKKAASGTPIEAFEVYRNNLAKGSANDGGISVPKKKPKRSDSADDD